LYVNNEAVTLLRKLFNEILFWIAGKESKELAENGEPATPE